MSPSPWRIRDFRLVWSGGLVNDLGDWLLLIALPVHIYDLTGSGSLTALLFLSSLLPSVVFGGPAGAMVDRWDLRKTMITTTLLQAVAALPLLTVTADRLWPLFAVSFVQSILARFNNPAKSALLPRLVGSDQLAVANSANAAGDSLARLVGSPLGGLVVAFGGLPAVIVLNIVCFLVAGLLVSLVTGDRGLPLARAHDRPPRLWADFKDGLGVIRRIRPLPALGVIHTLAHVSQGLFLVLFVVFVMDQLGGTGVEVGALRGIQAVGSILGSILIARWARRRAPGKVAGFGYLGFGLISLIVWNAPVFTTALPFYMVCFVIVGIPIVASAVGMTTAAQRFTPPDYLGRMFGALEAVGAAGAALGTALAGFLLEYFPITPVLNAQATLYLFCGALALILIAPHPLPDGNPPSHRVRDE